MPFQGQRSREVIIVKLATGIWKKKNKLRNTTRTRGSRSIGKKLRTPISTIIATNNSGDCSLKLHLSSFSYTDIFQEEVHTICVMCRLK